MKNKTKQEGTLNDIQDIQLIYKTVGISGISTVIPFK